MRGTKSLIGLSALVLSGCPDPETYNNYNNYNNQPLCDIPLQQQEVMVQQAFANQYGTLGWDVMEGSYATSEDLEIILKEIASIENVHGKYWNIDGGRADGFGAFTFPANTIIFHEDSARMSYAAGKVLMFDIITGLPEEEFRWKLQQEVFNIQFTPLGPAGYDSSSIDNDEATREYSLSALAGIAAHEASHIYNNDAEERICLTFQTGNPYLVAAFGYEQEKQADITAANFIADAYLQNPDGPLQPFGMILTMEILQSMENITGLSLGYPSAAQRMANVRQVFAERGIEVQSVYDILGSYDQW